MITNNGVLNINKFLVGANGEWAGTLAIGLLGTTATTSTTTEMQYEIDRYPINLKSYLPSITVTTSISGTSGQSTITVGSVTNLSVGMSVSGTGIGTGALITQISNLTVTLSVANSGTVSGNGTFVSPNRVVLKTTVPAELILSCYEMGVFPTRVTNDSVIDHTPISDFSEVDASNNSEWQLSGGTPATKNTTNTRIGGNSIQLNANNTASISNVLAEATGYNSNDYVDMLYYVSTTIVSGTAQIKLLSEGSTSVWSSNSVSFTTTASQNWGVVRMTMGARPDDFEDNISSASIVFTATSGQINLDHVKFIKNYTKSDEQKLTSRSASTSSFFSKQYGQTVDIEYSMKVT